MARFVALYSGVEEVDAFEEHYRATHLPLVESWPGVQRVEVTRFVATPRGTPPDYHLQCVAEFATDEEMAAALRSEAGAEAARDAKTMKERFGASSTMLLGDDF